MPPVAEILKIDGSLKGCIQRHERDGDYVRSVGSRKYEG